MSTTAAPTTLPEETIDLLTLRSAFRRPAGELLSVIDGKLIVWNEDILDLLTADGVPEGDLELFRKAISKKSPEMIEKTRAVYPLSNERFDQIANAATLTISRKNLREYVRENLDDILARAGR